MEKKVAPRAKNFRLKDRGKIALGTDKAPKDKGPLSEFQSRRQGEQMGVWLQKIGLNLWDRVKEREGLVSKGQDFEEESEGVGPDR